MYIMLNSCVLSKFVTQSCLLIISGSDTFSSFSNTPWVLFHSHQNFGSLPMKQHNQSHTNSYVYSMRLSASKEKTSLVLNCLNIAISSSLSFAFNLQMVDPIAAKQGKAVSLQSKFSCTFHVPLFAYQSLFRKWAHALFPGRKTRAEIEPTAYCVVISYPIRQ